MPDIPEPDPHLEEPTDAAETLPQEPPAAFEQACIAFGFNPSAIKAITLTPSAVYAVDADYPEPTQGAHNGD